MGINLWDSPCFRGNGYWGFLISVPTEFHPPDGDGKTDNFKMIDQDKQAPGTPALMGVGVRSSFEFIVGEMDAIHSFRP